MKLEPPVVLETEPEPAAWDALVQGAEAATAFHTSAWARLWVDHWPRARWEAILLPGAGGYDGGLGFIVRDGVFGCRIFSMPYATYGGPLVRAGHPDPASVRRRLLEGYARRIRSARVWFSDLQWYQGTRVDLPAGLSAQEGFTHVRSLDRDYAALLAQLPHSVRSRVRQAEEHGLTVTRVADARGVREYHALAVKTVLQRGGAPKPESLYQRILELLVPQGLARFDLVEHQGHTIAGSLHFTFHHAAFNWLTVADERHLALRPNHIVIARVMRDLCEAGVREYNFGGSPPDARGLIAFKESWGATQRTVLDIGRRSLLHRLLRG